MDGSVEWQAWVSGKAAAGTGKYGLAMVVAVHFAPSDAPDPPRFEALLARGRFVNLHDSELCDLRRSATPVVIPERDGSDRR